MSTLMAWATSSETRTLKLAWQLVPAAVAVMTTFSPG